MARGGSIAAYFPSSVIKGLLSAIGLILILKQIPHLLGHDADPVGEMSFVQPDAENTFSELWLTASHLHPGAALIGMASLLLLVAWDRIALVASLETLLDLEAVDGLDRYKRHSDPNRELLAQGVGNMTAGVVGGLPITSVIVRSSVNIQSGARTRLAAVFHGALLLLCVALLPQWLNRIPLSATSRC